MFSIAGPDGLFYANAVGAFGSVSAGQNWDRMESASRRWALKLVDNKAFSLSLFAGDALVMAESDISAESFVAVISHLVIP